MEYHGKLYGKGRGRTYFPMILTTEDVDRMEKENKEMRDALGYIHLILSSCEEGGRDLQLGSTSFKSCLKWASIHNAKVDARDQ